MFAYELFTTFRTSTLRLIMLVAPICRFRHSLIVIATKHYSPSDFKCFNLSLLIVYTLFRQNAQMYVIYFTFSYSFIKLKISARMRFNHHYVLCLPHTLSFYSKKDESNPIASQTLFLNRTLSYSELSSSLA